MKQYLAAVAAATLIAAPAPAFAQTVSSPAVARGDVAFTIGWLNGNKSELTGDRYNDWFNHGFYGAGHVGWYWSDHHKTEVEFGRSNTADLYANRTTVEGNIQTFRNSEFSFRTRRVAIGQQYQFYRNVWFHPHVTGGVDMIWERTTEQIHFLHTYNTVTRVSTQLPVPRSPAPDTKLRVQPFGEAGFKVYMTPRSFFRADLRITGRDRFDQVLFRCGFGIDF